MSPIEESDIVVPCDGTAVRVSAAIVLLPLSIMTSKMDTIWVSSAPMALEILAASCLFGTWCRMGLGIICGRGISSRNGGLVCESAFD